MKKFLAALPLLALGGCTAVQHVVTNVESFVKSPPAAVVTAFHVIVDSLLAILNALLHGALAGGIGQLFN